MPNTAAVYARIDPELKKEVDAILSELNVSPSSLIQMLYGQIKLTKGIPFEIRLPSKEPLFIDEMSDEELKSELERRLKQAEDGKTNTGKEVNAMLKKMYDI